MRKVTLSSVAEISGGWTSAAAPDGRTRLVRTTDISSGEVDWDTAPYCLSEPTNNALSLRHGDLLVARTGVGSVGNVALVSDPPHAVAASYLLRVRPSDEHDPEFILWYLRSSEGKDQLASRAVGSVIPNLSISRLETVLIPEIPLREQLEVASRLREIASLYRLTRSALRSAKSNLLRAQKRLWRIAVRRTGDDPTSWKLMRLGSLTASQDRHRIALNASQRAERRGDTPYYGASGVIDHVDDHTHDGTYLLLSEDGQNLESRKQDIAIVVSGRFWANNHIHVLQVEPGVLPEFVANFINATDVSQYLTGTAQPKLPAKRLKEIEVPVPSLAVQKMIVEEIERVGEYILHLEQVLGRVERELELAWSAELNRTFGGVTPNSPEDNSKADPRVGVSMTHESYASIRNALVANPEGLTPEQLFHAVKHTGGDSDERVDFFYSDLRDLVVSAEVREDRSDDSIMLRIR